MTMDTWFIVVVSLCLAALIRSVLFIRWRHRKKQLPPGPSIISSTFLLLTNSRLNFQPILINLKAKYGPFFTLSIGFRPSIFVASHSLAHQLLIQKGALFADRPKAFSMVNISSASYGPTWQLFRRNIASEIMNPSRVKSYSWACKWALRVLITRLKDQKEVVVIDQIQHVVFCLLTSMCLGEKFDESFMNEIAKVQREMLLKVRSGRFDILGMFPRLGKIMFKNRWKELAKLLSSIDDVMTPIINSRFKSVEDKENAAYVDTLVTLQIPNKDGNSRNGGKLTDKEVVSMCSEFINAGTDTTLTALQWIMANLVKHPHIQRKLFNDIIAVVGPPSPPPPAGVESVLINEEDLENMSYLKAVVLEGLRRHPPGYLGLPHMVTKEVEVQGYMIPQGAIINFMIAEMGLDPKVWDDPMEFKPERFLANNGVFDISGSQGITMMPFGAGRRICPASYLALLHLEYFVANLIWYFHWTVPDGYQVDLSEKNEITVAMKNPLRTLITSRAEK